MCSEVNQDRSMPAPNDTGKQLTVMPQYRCHKKVFALKIHCIETHPAVTGAMLHVEEPYAPILVDRAYMDKHNPAAGGYFVQYEDGYQSWSPAEAFEAGYTRIDPMAEIASAAREARKERLGDPRQDRYVIAVERDTADWMKSDGPIVWETKLSRASLYDAVERVDNLGAKYGKTWICRLLPLDLNECRCIIEEPPKAIQ